MVEFADPHDSAPPRRRPTATPDEASLRTDDTTLGETLRDLKRRGCSVLVTGAVPFETRAAMSRRLFGVPDERRFRLLAVTNSVGLPVARYLPDGLGARDDAVTVVDFADELRGGVAASSGDTGTATGSSPTVRTDDADRVASLGTSLSSAVATVADRVDTFAPGELRVGVASLSGPYDEEEADRVRTTLGSMVEDVVDHRGMVHCHLLGEADGRTANGLMPSFDVRIELRDRGTGTPEHRWVVPEQSVRTAWVPL
ncbi:hypothetical protein ACFPYI_00240 [Halomarina salina]|uniref:Uncharacterized protein n=1 Tax=Halomarina salina TaxID=1872699 RepID=A0ABD5RGQ6_9EURY|nr:hypothetical protein [Halomarina salina]